MRHNRWLTSLPLNETAVVTWWYSRVAVAVESDVVLRRCAMCGNLTERTCTKLKWNSGAPLEVTAICPRSECKKDYEKSNK